MPFNLIRVNSFVGKEKIVFAEIGIPDIPVKGKLVDNSMNLLSLI